MFKKIWNALFGPKEEQVYDDAFGESLQRALGGREDGKL